MQLRAPAKINLYLEVLGKRSDGYHDLISLMCCIGIYDTVRFSFGSPDASSGVSVACSHPKVPEDHNNLAYRAAKAFFSETGLHDQGLVIEIEKRIPVGAGLGGGSSNAAAVLSGLNRYYDHPIASDTLMEIGRFLGADVPFFIFGGPAVAAGIGEKLTRFSGLPAMPLVLIYPGRSVSTAEVYKKLNLALTKTKKIHTKSIFELDWETNGPKQLYNSLEPAAMELCPEIAAAKKALVECGAGGALMSGSGSSVFGIFKNTKKAETACRKISGHRQWQVFHTQLLA
ncbi:MAG: 4-(cytidine 5'-diphospho)-2-C-methyl-D-erythritol kinase [Desulfobacterales bacterium]|nr:4-(cytidine 5'-diphospho)-2-C-methyl-D-erythritol kinase [Desulfobacterales bacterium]